MKLPTDIKITEVGPRDGFQIIEKFIPTELKMEVIDKLVSSNFKKIEITSFVNPKAIPQMKDAAEIAKLCIQRYKDIELIALVPNLRGAQNAWKAGIKNITYVLSASESHNKANVNRTIDESFEELSNLKEALPKLKIKLDIATAFGCPFEGNISLNQLQYVIDKSIELKIDEICLCDTIGIADPLSISTVLKELSELYPNLKYSLHLHDTRGMGLANVLVALSYNITEFETSVSGLGGCPFAPGAAGNIASEDLVYMLEKMNINTNIDFNNLIKTSKLIKSKIKYDLTSHLVYVNKP